MTIDRTLKNQKYLLATIVMMLFVVYGVLFYQYHYSQKEKESIKREVMYNKVLLMKSDSIKRFIIKNQIQILQNQDTIKNQLRCHYYGSE